MGGRNQLLPRMAALHPKPAVSGRLHPKWPVSGAIPPQAAYLQVGRL